MSDPVLNDQVDVYVTASSHLFTFQKMLAVTNSLVLVTAKLGFKPRASSTALWYCGF
jgi:hypothetical protein